MLPVDDALAARYTLGGVPLNRSPLAHKANRNGQSGYALEPGKYTIIAEVAQPDACGAGCTK
jgi:hypothetical protein